MSEHTPTPWKQGSTNIYSNDNKVIGDTRHLIDAALIVRAVNSHEAMKEALKELSLACQGVPALKGKIVDAVTKARAALALAEGK